MLNVHNKSHTQYYSSSGSLKTNIFYIVNKYMILDGLKAPFEGRVKNKGFLSHMLTAKSHLSLHFSTQPDKSLRVMEYCFQNLKPGIEVPKQTA